MAKFNWRFALLLGLTGVLTNTFWVAFNAYVPIFLQSGHPLAANSTVVGFALSPFIANFIMTWDNIVHMFLNPWIGARSDRTWNRWGRRKPWLLIGFPIATVGFVLIPYATSLAAIMLFIMLTNLGTGLYRSPLKAWVGDFYAPVDRPKGEAAFHIMAGLAVVVVSIVGGILFDQVGRGAPFLLSIGIMAVVAVFVIVWVQEKEPPVVNDASPPQQPTDFLLFLKTLRLPKDRNLLFSMISVIAFTSAHAAFQTNLTAFGVFELDISAGRAGLLLGVSALVYVVCAIPSSLLATRFGARRIMMGGMLLYAVLALLIVLFATTEGTLLAPLLLTGFAWALVSVNGLPLILNFDRENSAGLFTGLYYFAFQFASIVGPLAAGMLISTLGSQRAMLGFVIFAMLVAFAALLQVRPTETV